MEPTSDSKSSAAPAIVAAAPMRATTPNPVIIGSIFVPPFFLNKK
jgi:hypothetical protein